MFLFFQLFVNMDRSSNADSSNIEEENTARIQVYEDSGMPLRKKIRFVNINEIVTFERISQIHNKNLMESNPTLSTLQDIKQQNLHFIDTKQEQYLMIDDKKESIKDMICKQDKKWQININLTNIRRQNLLRLEIEQFKRNHTFTVETHTIDQNRIVGYKYTLTMVDGALDLKIWIEVDGNYKIWKEMQVPILQNPIILQINQLNNEQTTVKINQFLFHLMLRMPFYQEVHYHLIHQSSLNIIKIELQSIVQKKYYEDIQTNCSNQCQLI